MSTFSPLTIDQSIFVALSNGYYQHEDVGFGDPTNSLRIGSLSQNQRKDRAGNTYREYILPITRTYDVYVSEEVGYRPITLTCTVRVPEGLPAGLRTYVDQVFSDMANFVTPERLSQMLTGRR